MSSRPYLFALACAALASCLQAGDAVSGLNGKASASYGDFDSADGASYQGSIAFPLAPKWGAQFDGLYNRIGGLDFGGVGGHLFWRDSELALVGLALSAVDSTNSTNYQAGFEAEYYLPWMTIGAFAGVGGIDYDVVVPFIDTERHDLAGTFYLGFYPLPDLLVRPKLALAHENLSYGAEIEYALPRYNVSLIAETIHSEHDFQQHQIGLRYYFGGKKSLKARHREDDPVSAVADTLNALGTYGAEYNQRLKDYVSPSFGYSFSYGSWMTHADPSEGVFLGVIVRESIPDINYTGSEPPATP
jgi:hypothetical protein